MAPRKTVKTSTPAEAKREQNTELKELREKLNKALFDLGAANTRLAQAKEKNEQLEQELAEEKSRNERRDQVVTIRITKTAFKNLNDYVTRESYKSVSNLIADIICGVSYTEKTIRHALHPDYTGGSEQSQSELQDFRLEDQHQGDPV